MLELFFENGQNTQIKVTSTGESILERGLGFDNAAMVEARISPDELLQLRGNLKVADEEIVALEGERSQLMRQLDEIGREFRLLTAKIHEYQQHAIKMEADARYEREIWEKTAVKIEREKSVARRERSAFEEKLRIAEEANCTLRQELNSTKEIRLAREVERALQIPEVMFTEELEGLPDDPIELRKYCRLLFALTRQQGEDLTRTQEESRKARIKAESSEREIRCLQKKLENNKTETDERPAKRTVHIQEPVDDLTCPLTVMPIHMKYNRATSTTATATAAVSATKIQAPNKFQTTKFTTTSMQADGLGGSRKKSPFSRNSHFQF
jgi:hypothetical protein